MAFQSFVFLHIEKCGGSAIRGMIHQAMRDRYPDQRLHIPGINASEDSNLVQLGQHSLDALRRRRIFCVADHSPHALAETWLGLSNPFYFTVLREPVPRILSHYYYFHATQRGPLTELSEEALEMGLQSEVVNLMTLRLSGYRNWRDDLRYQDKCKLLETLRERALANLSAMPAVGVLERLSDSIALLNRTNPFGLRFAAPGRANANPAPKPVTDDIVERIRYYSRFDQTVYRFARERLNSLLEEAPQHPRDVTPR